MLATEELALLIVILEFFVVIGYILAGSKVLNYVDWRGLMICSFLGDGYTDITEVVKDFPWVFFEASPSMV